MICDWWTSGWFQPIWNILVKIGKGEHKKNSLNHHLVDVSFGGAHYYWGLWPPSIPIFSTFAPAPETYLHATPDETDHNNSGQQQAGGILEVSYCSLVPANLGGNYNFFGGIKFRLLICIHLFFCKYVFFFQVFC